MDLIKAFRIGWTPTSLLGFDFFSPNILAHRKKRKLQFNMVKWCCCRWLIDRKHLINGCIWSQNIFYIIFILIIKYLVKLCSCMCALALLHLCWNNFNFRPNLANGIYMMVPVIFQIFWFFISLHAKRKIKSNDESVGYLLVYHFCRCSKNRTAVALKANLCKFDFWMNQETKCKHISVCRFDGFRFFLHFRSSFFRVWVCMDITTLRVFFSME